MKKVKIMLLSLALLAIVGGALAFKAKSPVQYCTTPTIAGTCGEPATFTCPNLVFSTVLGVTAEPFVCYTTPQFYVTEVGLNFGCAYNIGNWQEGDYRTNIITCTTSQKLKPD